MAMTDLANLQPAFVTEESPSETGASGDVPDRSGFVPLSYSSEAHTPVCFHFAITTFRATIKMFAMFETKYQPPDATTRNAKRMRLS